MTGATEQEYLEKIDALTHTVSHLQDRLRWFEKQVFGQKADRILTPPPEALSLFGQSDIAAKPVEPQKVVVTYERTKAKGHGRNAWPDSLPRVEEIEEPGEILCACGRPKTKIGEDTTEILEQIPKQLFVRRIIRPKYACPLHPENGISQAKVKSRFIPKGNVGEALVTHIILQKYVNHMPLSRQEKDYKRLGVHLPVSSMLSWIEFGAKSLSKIVDAMRSSILKGDIAYSDDTPIPVLHEDKKEATHRGFMWMYSSGESEVVFDYRHGRGRDGPLSFLEGFHGYLHSDAYAGYGELHKTGVVPVYCFAHARRKFVEALDAGDERARRVVVLIGRLFLVERYAKSKGMSCDAVKAVRSLVSREIMSRLERYFKRIELTVLPQSLLGRGMGYLRGHWKEFSNFLEDGRLSLDNNFSERQLRAVVIGRKNYMFCGSEEGAKRAAVFYSIAASCKLVGVDPWKYMAHVFNHLAQAPDTEPALLTPKAFQKQQV
jgi:transposase